MILLSQLGCRRRVEGVVLSLAGLVTMFACTVSPAQDLMITGIMDGDLPGGQPKFIELYALNNIPDLSQYAFSGANNGAASFGSIDPNNDVLPNVSLNAGDFYYGVGGPSADMLPNFDLVFPAKSGIRARISGVNSNGDDVTGLFHDPTGAFTGSETQIDVFGELGVDGTGTAWEHTDGWAYRNNDRRATTLFAPSHWTISDPGALDGLDELGHAAAFPDMTFVPAPPAPDPTSFSWKSDQSGDWLLTANWDPAGIPNDVNHDAKLGDVITTTQTVFTNSPVSVRAVEFDSPHSYVVAGAGSINLTLGTAPSPPPTSITVLQGSNNQFQAAVKLLTDTSVDVSSSATVIFNNSLDLNGNTLTKTGDGVALINNQLLTGGGLAGGFVVAEGVLGGSGKINGDVNNSGGTISPGNLAAGSSNLAGVPEPSGLFLLGLSIMMCAYGCPRSRKVPF